MTTILIATLVVIAFSAFVKGMVGFGNGLVAAPILLVFYEPADVVVLILFLSLLMDIFNALRFAKYVKFNNIIPLIVASLIGLPLGTYVLLVVDTSVLKLGIGILVSCFAVLQIMGWKYPITKPVLAQSIVGFLCGSIGAATSITGPPIALFYSNQGMNKKEFRGSMAAFFLVLYVSTMVTYFASGILTYERLASSVSIVPAMVVGLIAGSIVSHYIQEALFQKIALVIILLSGIVAIVSAL